MGQKSERRESGGRGGEKGGMAARVSGSGEQRLLASPYVRVRVCVCARAADDEGFPSDRSGSPHLLLQRIDLSATVVGRDEHLAAELLCRRLRLLQVLAQRLHHLPLAL